MGEGCVLTECGPLAQIDNPVQWPSGEFLLETIRRLNAHTDNTNIMMTGDPKEDTANGEVILSNYWQTSVQWALLTKFGYGGDGIPTQKEAYSCAPSDPAATPHRRSRQLLFTREQMACIQSRWSTVADEASTSSNGTTAAAGAGNTTTITNNNLVEFLQQGGRSNQRQLQWTVMNCQAGCQFQLHAHPNLELIYCASGALHEVRMSGEPLVQGDMDLREQHGGPNLTRIHRSWHFSTLGAGEWLVN
jgi:hypothetical protein